MNINEKWLLFYIIKKSIFKRSFGRKDFVNEQQEVEGILTETGTIYKAPCVILCTGTYLRSKIFWAKIVI